MKRWILPAIAVGVAVFLLTERGRNTQEKVASNIGDWTDQLLRINEKVQEKLQQAQNALERFQHALEGSER